MANFLRDNSDLQFYMKQWLKWDDFFDVTELYGLRKDGFTSAKDAQEFYGDIMDLVGQFVADEIAPYAAEMDRDGLSLVDGEPVFPPRLKGIFDQIQALELYGMNLPRELGGQNCPMMLYMMQTEALHPCRRFGDDALQLSWWHRHGTSTLLDSRRHDRIRRRNRDDPEHSIRGSHR